MGELREQQVYIRDDNFEVPWRSRARRNEELIDFGIWGHLFVIFLVFFFSFILGGFYNASITKILTVKI